MQMTCRIAGGWGQAGGWTVGNGVGGFVGISRIVTLVTLHNGYIILPGGEVP